MKALLRHTFYVFALLGIIFIPSASYIIPIQDNFAIWAFGDLINLFVSDHLDFASDTAGLNLLLALLFVLAMLLVAILNRLTFWKEHSSKIINIIQVIMFYYLASRMLVYGFDKVFKTQFYLPEPNILHTRLGYLSKDILFWSVMGTSKWYCILSGIAEIIPAVMLLFKRTRVAGLLMLTFILLHVFTINIGFDISVKLYTLFLLFLTLLLLSPHFHSLYDFFIKRTAVQLRKEQAMLIGREHLKKSFKFFAVGMIFIEALNFPISTGYLNDDQVPRPYLHGAYEVYDVQTKKEIYAPEDPLFKRFYIHRRNYFIFEYANREMVDYQLKIDRNKQVLRLEDYNNKANIMPYRLYCEENCLDIGMIHAHDTLWYMAHRIEQLTLPALQDEFHWTIDAFQKAE